MTAKRNALENVLRALLHNEGKAWSELYRFVNRRKGIRENIPSLKYGNGNVIDSVPSAITRHQG